MNKEQKMMLRFCIVYLISYMSFAFASNQIIPYLTAIGYNSIERGILISTYSIITIILQLVVGILSDKWRTIKKLCLVSLAAFAIMSLVFYSFEMKIFSLHLIILALSGGLCNLQFGLIDNWVIESNQYLKNKYSFIRAFGSIGWGIASIIIATIITKFGYKGVGISILSAVIITLFLMIFIADASKATQSNVHDTISKEDLKSLFSKKYILLIIIMFLLNCAGRTGGLAVIDKMIIIGATNADIGIRWSILAFIEIPIYFLGGTILHRLGPKKLLIIACIVMTFQYIAYGITNSVIMILFISALNVLAGPMMNLGSRMLVFDYSSDKLKSTGSLVGISVWGGLSGVVIPTLSGVISSFYGINTAIYFASICAVIALVLMPLLYKVDK